MSMTSELHLPRKICKNGRRQIGNTGTVGEGRDEEHTKGAAELVEDLEHVVDDVQFDVWRHLFRGAGIWAKVKGSRRSNQGIGRLGFWA